jgi:transposase
MVRMLLVGYCFGIRSERRLCDEVHLNLAYRWFCRPGLALRAHLQRFSQLSRIVGVDGAVAIALGP